MIMMIVMIMTKMMRKTMISNRMKKMKMIMMNKMKKKKNCHRNPKYLKRKNLASQLEKRRKKLKRKK